MELTACIAANMRINIPESILENLGPSAMQFIANAKTWRIIMTRYRQLGQAKSKHLGNKKLIFWLRTGNNKKRSKRPIKIKTNN